jgi:hypothetical protein
MISTPFCRTQSAPKSCRCWLAWHSAFQVAASVTGVIHRPSGRSVSCNGVPGVNPTPASVLPLIVNSGTGWGVKVMFMLPPNFDVQACAHPIVATACAVLDLSLCDGLGHGEPPYYCVTTWMSNWPGSVIVSIRWPVVKAIGLNS